MGSNPTPRINYQDSEHLELLNINDFYRWLSWRYKHATVITTIKRLRRLVKLLGGFSELLEQEKMVNAILSMNVSAGSKNNYLICYMRFLRYANVKPLPITLDAIKHTRRLAPKKLAKIPSMQTIMAAISATRSDSKLRLALALGFYSGLRLNEIRNLKWSQIDLEQNRILIEESEKRSEPSILPIAEPLALMLRSYKRDSEYICRFNERSIYQSLKMLKRRLKRMGYDDADLLCFKNLRHAFATTLYAKTKDLIFVQRMLRHKSISSTQRYIHLVIDSKVYDVKIAHENEHEIIRELLEAGYEFITKAGKLMFFRRPRT